MKNLDNREHLVRLVRNDAPKSGAGASSPKAFRVFTDNSAFNIEREYDASK
jgi:hypothetical protein